MMGFWRGKGWGSQRKRGSWKTSLWLSEVLEKIPLGNPKKTPRDTTKPHPDDPLKPPIPYLDKYAKGWLEISKTNIYCKYDGNLKGFSGVGKGSKENPGIPKKLPCRLNCSKTKSPWETQKRLPGIPHPYPGGWKSAGDDRDGKTLSNWRDEMGPGAICFEQPKWSHKQNKYTFLNYIYIYTCFWKIIHHEHHLLDRHVG